MAHLLAERSGEASNLPSQSKYERLKVAITKTKTGTTPMSTPHPFKNPRLVTDEERKRQQHFDKRISHEVELDRERQERERQERERKERERQDRERDRERERQAREDEARERDRRDADRRSSSSYIPTGPSRGTGYSGGHHQQARQFQPRETLSGTSVAPSPRDRGVLNRDGPLVVNIPTYPYDDTSNARRNSEQYSPQRHRNAPKPVIGEKNEVPAVSKDPQDEEKFATMLKQIKQYKEVATDHMQAEKEYKNASGAIPAFTTMGKKYEGVQKLAAGEITKLLQRRMTAKDKAEDIGRDFHAVLADMVRYEMSQYNIQKQGNVPNASSEEVVALRKQMEDMTAKMESIGKAVEKPRHPDQETINLQRRCDDLSQKIDSRKDYTDRINKAEIDIGQLNIFRKAQERTNEDYLGKFKKINESMTSNRDEIDKTKREVKEGQKKTAATLEEHSNFFKNSEQKLSELLQKFTSLQDKMSTTVTEAEELKEQLEGRYAELKKAIDGLKQSLEEKSRIDEVARKEQLAKEMEVAKQLHQALRHVTAHERLICDLDVARNGQEVKYLGMLKAIDSLQTHSKKTLSDVVTHFESMISLLMKEMDIITKAPAIEATDQMLRDAESEENALMIVKREQMNGHLTPETVDDDWQSDPKIAKFAEEMLAKLRNEVNPDIFNPERIQLLRTQVGALGERLSTVETAVAAIDGHPRADGGDFDQKLEELKMEIWKHIKQSLSEFKIAQDAREAKIAQHMGICEALVEDFTERFGKHDIPPRAQSVAITNGHANNSELARDMPTRLTRSAMPSPPTVARTPPFIRSSTPKSVTTSRDPHTDKRDAVVSNPTTPPSIQSPVNRSTPVVTTYSGTIQLPADSRWRAVPSLAGHKRPRATDDLDGGDRVVKRDSN